MIKWCRKIRLSEIIELKGQETTIKGLERVEVLVRKIK